MKCNPYLFETQAFFADMLGEYILRFCELGHPIDYERRRELTARGSPTDGAGRGGRRSPRRRARIRYGALADLDPRELTRRARVQQIAAEQLSREERRALAKLEREQRVAFDTSERQRKREIERFVRYAKCTGLKIKRAGHGLAKQAAVHLGRPLTRIPKIGRTVTTEQVKRSTRRITRRDALDVAYATKLDQAYGDRTTGSAAAVENPGDLFLSLPSDQRVSILDTASVRHHEWLDNDKQTIGYDFNPLFAYH
jgi:hypothetical protein